MTANVRKTRSKHMKGLKKNDIIKEFAPKHLQIVFFVLINSVVLLDFYVE